MQYSQSKVVAVAAALAAALSLAFPAHAWEPTKNVEFIIPAGTGGGADQMARAIPVSYTHLTLPTILRV